VVMLFLSALNWWIRMWSFSVVTSQVAAVSDGGSKRLES
jgi:hypothetical protein